MISINKVNKEECCQCTSCQCENEDTDIYKIDIGKDERQTVVFRLCYECMCNFIGRMVINK